MEVLHSKIKSLSLRLESISAEVGYLTHTDLSIKEVNLRHNVANSIAKFIVLAGIRQLPSLAEFQSQLDIYNDANGTSFTISWFLQNFWIRVINDKVITPDNVISALNLSSANVVPPQFEEAARCLRTIRTPLYPPATGVDVLQLSPLTQTEIDFLVSKQILTLENDRYFLASSDYVRYLRNEIWALVWIILFESQSMTDSKQRVRHFAELIMCYEFDLPDRLNEFLQQERLDDIHDGALAVLLQEDDLIDNGEEFQKSWFDNHHFRRNIFEPIPSIQLKKESPYDLLEQVKGFQSSYQDIFLLSESRGFYTILMRLVIVTDDRLNSGTRAMLKEVTRPYLVYNVYFTIKRNYPSILPSLLIDDNLAPIFFRGLNDVEVDKNIIQKYSEYETHDEIRTAIHRLKSEIWFDGFEAFLYKMSASADPGDEVVNGLFQILWSQARLFYKKPNQFDQEIHAEDRKRFEDSIKMVAELRPRGRYFSGIKPRIFPKITERLFHAITKVPNTYRNEFIQLSQARFELAIQMHKFASMPLFTGEVSPSEVSDRKLLRHEIAKYLKDITQKFYTDSVIEVLNLGTGEVKDQKPKWSIPTFGFEILEWGYFFLSINEIGLLDDFFKSVESQFLFDGQHQDSIYHDDNQNTYEKARFFVKAIACGIIELNSKSSSYFTDSVQTVQVQNRLIELLSHYSMRFAVTDLTNNRVNIFDERFKFSSDLYYKSLLSIVFSAVNLLGDEEKTEFVRLYIEQDTNFARLLGIVNLVEGDTARRVVHDSLENLSLDEFIESASMTTEWRDAMIEAINSDDFFSFAEPLSQRLEAHITSLEYQNENDKHLLFEVKLLHAFKSRNWAGLQEIPVPPNRYHHNTYIKLESLKQFFIGMYKLYNDKSYKEAEVIFSQLYSNESENAEYAYRLFHTRTMDAVANEDLDAMKYAMDQWTEFSQRANNEAKKVLSALANNIRYTSIFSFIQFHEFVNLDITLQGIPPAFRYDSEIVAGVFDLYLKRHLDELGFDYLSQARRYHAANSTAIPRVIEDLYNTVDDEKHISRLRSSFSDIYSLTADRIIRTIPGKLNDGKVLDHFILIEIVRAGKILMEKVEALNDIKWENKYNDLLQAIMRFRIAVWGWNIPDQGRAGASNSGGGDLGSTDFKIECADETITLIEALILEGKNRNKVEEHIFKCNQYVTHLTRMYVVTYYKGKPENFVRTWESYQEDVLDLNYNPTFKLIDKTFVDQDSITKKSRNIKVGLTRHESGVNMFHIFFNVAGA